MCNIALNSGKLGNKQIQIKRKYITQAHGGEQGLPSTRILHHYKLCGLHKSLSLSLSSENEDNMINPQCLTQKLSIMFKI